METSEFDYALPDELIAQHPVEPRDQARLMVVRRDSQTIEHRTFAELPDLLDPGDVLVRNNTRVVPARLIGRRKSTGGKWEGLFLRECVQPVPGWEILATTRGRPVEGEHVVVGDDPESTLLLTLVARGEGGRWIVRPESADPASVLLERHGQVPPLRISARDAKPQATGSATRRSTPESPAPWPLPRRDSTSRPMCSNASPAGAFP